VFSQRAICDSYGIVFNVITSDQHHWCGRSFARLRSKPKHASLNAAVQGTPTSKVASLSLSAP
jgi:hypothetical protein